MGDQKGFSMVFAFVTLLSCCQASNFFLPRVSRTDDAIIIDLDGSGTAAPFQGKTLYGQVANPGFIPVPSFGPYPMMFRQPSGWPYPSVYPSSFNPAGVPLQKQFYGEEEGSIDGKQAPAASTCGVGPATMPTSRSLASERIVGGETAKKNAWPFMVALKKSDGSIFCSGTLLSDSKVLLAAQCLEKMSLFELNGVTALVGMNSGDQSDVQMTRKLGKIVLHEKYNAINFANDIAIVTLEYPVPLSKTLGPFPACLPPLQNTDPDQYVDTPAMIVGWGTTDAKKPNTPLQQALVGFSNNVDCKNDKNVGKYDTDSTMCIISDKNDRFTCVADVGGPVVTLPSPGAWTVIAINSYTKDCTVGGLKTKVSAFKDWIDKYMK